MNKIKNVFQRSQKTVEERRPYQFIKRHSSVAARPSLIEITSEQPNASPAIELFDLSEIERPSYQAWWKDLDPFGHGKISNQAVLKFLSGCTLEDNKLEQILALFETAGDGLNQLQFFAMLRLIAHAQNGRKISKALVYLGAPVPHFNTNAIEALIKSGSTRNEKEPLEKQPWWGTESQQLQTPPPNRHSYIAPCEPKNQPTYFYSATNNDGLWSPAPSAPPLLSQPTVHKNEHTHSRSKSASNATRYMQPLGLQEQLHSSKSSLSLHELNNTGKSLLLTQKFVYQSPSLRKQELSQPTKASNNNYNPFHSITPPDIYSPFDDDSFQSTVESIHIPINNKPNKDLIPPPPVPDQSTKPAFPKYARNIFMNQKDLLT
ncbi:hypothetical protein G6F46_011401 [Rhizopus delemar]|uniref:EH domain-containing protein n=2 Tax=Rhizopus TaxID=4842 RepID=A0A9P6YSC2_9FUNG|nr:hypothetical protein G6F55_010919 [Rhizopus delemar]KAG1534352.1 hypothetical protein G6F51_012140 [Rhizopus arrhizus]KAG1488999.1 hypothetical protein G6F54_011755 [Rhizopus delemar]KAG1497418.1 hypothetical protein G6F53_011973 [Rhizopus delemar]KAG1542228.1 hypothetical protein G6F49_011689 [Rhizopus delemar]